MPDLGGVGGVFHMTIEVKRAATGKVETYNIVARPVADEEMEKDEVK